MSAQTFCQSIFQKDVIFGRVSDQLVTPSEDRAMNIVYHISLQAIQLLQMFKCGLKVNKCEINGDTVVSRVPVTALPIKKKQFMQGEFA